MSEERDLVVRKQNYDYGMEAGTPVFCAQDLKEFKGLRIEDVTSNEEDGEAIIYLESEDSEQHVAVFLCDSLFDGERIKVRYLSSDIDNSAELVQLTEEDLKEVSGMVFYSQNMFFDERENVSGQHFTYCNSKELEGEVNFVTKGIYVYYDGRIMTEKNERRAMTQI